VARGGALAAAIAVSLLAVSGAGGAATQQTPKRGGTVVVGGAVVSEPGCLNAYLLRCGSPLPHVRGLMGLALRGAFRIDVAPHYAYRPDLVSGVEYTTKPPYTLTYHIRPEAHWSDGVSITARDFEFTYAALRSVEQEMWEPDAEYYAKVRSVTAVDAKTVRVVLRSRLAGWRGLFPRVLPSHALRGEDFSTVWLDGINNPKTGRAIGSGPFLVGHWEHGRSVTFVRNPRYWRNHPAFLDRLVLRFCQQCGAIGAEHVEWLRTGEVDVVMSPVLTDEQVQALRSSRGVRVLPNQGANWEHLDIRMDTGGHPALESKLVRQALAYGIDRVALARALNGRFEARYPPSDSAMFLTNSAHYRPNWQRYRYRPAEARRLLERAGCRREPDGIHACEGRRLSIRLATLAGSPRRQQALELIQRQLRQVGIEIVPVYAPPNVLFNEILPGGNFDLAAFSYLRFPDAAGGVVGLYGCRGVQNFAGYCQRLLTSDLDQAQRILNPARQADVLNRADAQLARDLPVIPLFENPQVVAHTTNVRNLRRTAQLDPFVGVENWWLER
jgi:peptide/nickel transport system substrate-binding protein